MLPPRLQEDPFPTSRVDSARVGRELVAAENLDHPPHEIGHGRRREKLTQAAAPFQFSRWEQANFLELRAFDRFYGGRPAIDRVVIRMIENKTSALQEYLAGGLDSLDETPDKERLERWAAETESRLDAIDRGELATRPGEEVLADLRRKYS